MQSSSEQPLVVRAKRCDAVDWALLKQADSAYFQQNLDFYRNSTRLSSRHFFWYMFCS